MLRNYNCTPQEVSAFEDCNSVRGNAYIDTAFAKQAVSYNQRRYFSC